MEDKIQTRSSYFIDNAKIALPSVIIGMLITYFVIDKVVIVGKDVNIRNFETIIKTEQGRSQVLEERLKAQGDRINYLSERLNYKPQDDRIELEKLQSERDYLAGQVTGLKEINEKLQSLGDEKLDIAKLEISLDSLLSENNRLRSSLNKYENEVIVRAFYVKQGSSWVGFGGKAALGLNTVVLTSDAGSLAKVTVSFEKSTEMNVKAGSTIPFTIAGKAYLVAVEDVQYVGSFITISVFRASEK